MAMTKKEKAELEALKEMCSINKALGWRNYQTEPDLEIPSEGVVLGWGFAAYQRTVFPTWSERSSHGHGHDIEKINSRYRSASQKGIKQFSTEAKALAALRSALESDFAEKLRNIDERLARSLLAEKEVTINEL